MSNPGPVAGQQLASFQYPLAPMAQVSYNITSTILAAVDPVNLTFSFTPPGSGNVNIDLGIDFAWIAPTNATDAFLGFLLHGTNTPVGLPHSIGGAGPGQIIGAHMQTRFPIAGLTPGQPIQLDLAAACSSVAAGYYFGLYVAWINEVNISNDPCVPCSIQVFAA